MQVDGFALRPAYSLPVDKLPLRSLVAATAPDHGCSCVTRMTATGLLLIPLGVSAAFCLVARDLDRAAKLRPTARRRRR